tara:strand:- start:90 stop:1103 length:1014 start_codon:yes stop_codon:yes gene_type:complete
MTTGGSQFVVDFGWQALLRELGISAQDVLRLAGLPLDLFSRETPTLSTAAYFKLWDAIMNASGDPLFPLKVGQAFSAETFSPPLFACYCSADLNTALDRLAQYKPLVGPLRFRVVRDDTQTSLTIEADDAGSPPTDIPLSYFLMEQVFLVHMARSATREKVVPLNVMLAEKLSDAAAYEAFFGCRVSVSGECGMVFSAADASRAFLTANDSMWSIFEPELRIRMGDLKRDASFQARVRACLTERLAGGHCTMSEVARHLAVSDRTLQRRLADEGTSFQKEITRLREELAAHYLTRSVYTNAEIAFLLGYDDPNSFVRAFHDWTGSTPDRMRAEHRVH